MLKETIFNKYTNSLIEIDNCFYDNPINSAINLIRLINSKYFSIIVYTTQPVYLMKQPVSKSLMFYNLPTLSQFYISPSHYMFHIFNRNCNVYSKCFIDCHVIKTYCVFFQLLKPSLKMCVTKVSSLSRSLFSSFSIKKYICKIYTV